MPAQGTRRPQDRSIATRAAIVSGAARAFARHGYASATLAQIARETKVTNGAFYFHFPTREAVALAVIDGYEQVVRQVVAEQTDRGRTGLPLLLAVSASFAHRIRRDPMVQAGLVLTTERTGLPHAAQAPYGTWIAHVTAALTAAQQAGDVAADLDADALAAHLVAAFTGVQTVSAALSGRTDLADRLRRSWTFVLPAIVPRERLDAALRSLDEHLPGPAPAA
jgi:AcrR family transcriptional regulator